jgi:hypothetical protein
VCLYTANIPITLKVSIPLYMYMCIYIRRVGQKQLDDLNLAPCRHLCRWRSETHRWVEWFEAFSHHAALVGRASSVCCGNVFLKTIPLL